MKFVAEAAEFAMELGTGTHLLEISSGVLKGRMAEFTIDQDGSLSETKIEGGMWIVKSAWTFTGMQNPLASYQNMSICVCWIILFLSIGVLLPPFRTMRSAVWRAILPGALKAATQSIRLNSKRMNQIERGSYDGDSASNEEDGLDDTGEEMRLATRGTCGYFLTTLYGGSLAQYTAFEPRMLAFTPPDPTVETLVQLCYEVSRCLRIAVGIELFMDKDDNSGFLQENLDEFDKNATILEKCAQAMLTGDATILDTVELKESSSEPDIETHHDPFRFNKATSNVVCLVRQWLQQMSGGKTEGLVLSSKLWHTNLLKVIAPWIYVQISLFLFLFRALLRFFSKASWEVLFRREFYSLPKLIWCVKYAFGMTVLLLMLIAWPEYRENFVVTSEDDPLRDRYGPQNGGWVIIAYCFATTQTAEGSIKKGILRMLGTVFGAFSGWLALLACEDRSYEYYHNTYGIIAWLAITSFLAVYVSTERGFAARISLSNDYAFGPIYFVITEIIIIFYGYFVYGPESRNAITINRMLANLVGIAFGMVLAIIPPQIYGGDPGHCRSIVHLYRDNIIEVLQMLLSDEIIPGTRTACEERYKKVADELIDLREKYLFESKKMQETAVDFEKDASKLQMLPRFKVDKNLKGEIGKVTRDIHVAAYVPEHAARMLLDPEKRSLMLGENSRGREELENMLLKLKGGIDLGGETRTKSSEMESSESELDLELLLRTINWLAEEIKKHEDAFNSIKWGF
jgi:hypothetical protein